MKKRVISLLIVMLLIISLVSVMTVFAGSGSVSFSGDSKVVAGNQYTYTYTLNVSGLCSANANISVGGAFEKVSGGDGLFYDTIPDNTSGNVSGSVTVRVKSDAKPGDIGTLSASGGGNYVDESGGVPEVGISGRANVTVIDNTPASTDAPAASNSDPEKTQKPSSTHKPASTPKPTPTRKPSAWELTSDEVDGMKEGGTLTADLTDEDDDHKIPIEIYNVLREKKGLLTLNFGTYSCTLNGAALGELDEDEDDLDLRLSFDTDEDYSEAVSGHDIYQLHFKHKGEFPGKISFTFKADKNSPGDTVYLYYYYATSDVIEGIQSATVDEDGNVTFDIYHCSSYFVSSSIIEGATGIVTEPKEEPEPSPSPTPEPTATPTPEPTPEPTPAFALDTVKTVTPPPIQGYPLVVLISVGLGAALIAVLLTMIVFRVGPFRKKRTRHSEY